MPSSCVAYVTKDFSYNDVIPINSNSLRLIYVQKVFDNVNNFYPDFSVPLCNSGMNYTLPVDNGISGLRQDLYQDFH